LPDDDDDEIVGGASCATTTGLSGTDVVVEEAESSTTNAATGLLPVAAWPEVPVVKDPQRLLNSWVDEEDERAEEGREASGSQSPARAARQCLWTARPQLMQR